MFSQRELKELDRGYFNIILVNDYEAKIPDTIGICIIRSIRKKERWLYSIAITDSCRIICTVEATR